MTMKMRHVKIYAAEHQNLHVSNAPVAFLVLCSCRTSDGSSSGGAATTAAKKKFPCDWCPYVAGTPETLKNHVAHHTLNPDADFVCKKCPYYCYTKIELGIHTMVHAMHKRNLETGSSQQDQSAGGSSVEKRPKLDEERMDITESEGVVGAKDKSEKPAEERKPPPQQQHKHHSRKSSTPVRVGFNMHLQMKLGEPAAGSKRSPSASPSAKEMGASSGSKKKAPHLQCNLCPYLAYTHRDISTHLEKHTPSPGRSIKCRYCEYYVSGNAALASHYRIHGQKMDKEEKSNGQSQEDQDEKVVIPKKRKSLSSKNEEKNREKMEERNDKTPEPPSVKKAKTGEQKSTEDSTSSKEGSVAGVFTCTLCPQKFKFRSSVRKHMLLHTPSESRQFACSHCSYSSATAGYLKIHEAVHRKGEEQNEDIDDTEEEELVDDEITSSSIGDIRRSFRGIMRDLEITSSVSVSSESGSDNRSVAEGEHTCHICPYTTNHKRLMKMHTAMHSADAERQERCDYCPYYMASRSHLWRHMVVHPEFKKLGVQRPVTGETSEEGDTEEDFETENEEECMEAEVEEGAETAKPTVKETGRSSKGVRYEIHSTTDEDGQKTYVCKKCPYTTPYRRLIKAHNTKHEPSEDRQACCDYCEYYVTSRGALAKHLEVHNEHQRKQTGGAGNTAELRDTRVEEQRQSTETEDLAGFNCIDDEAGGKIYFCEICPYSCAELRVVKTHAAKHCPSSERPICCDFCPFYVKTLSELQDHMNIHEEYRDKSQNEDSERPICCDFCPFYVKTLAELQDHMNIHEEYRSITQAGDVTCGNSTDIKEEIEDDMSLSPDMASQGSPLADGSVAAVRHCHLCPYTTVAAHSLKRHIEFHSPDNERQVGVPGSVFTHAVPDFASPLCLCTPRPPSCALHQAHAVGLTPGAFTPSLCTVAESAGVCTSLCSCFPFCLKDDCNLLAFGLGKNRYHSQGT